MFAFYHVFSRFLNNVGRHFFPNLCEDKCTFGHKIPIFSCLSLWLSWAKTSKHNELTCLNMIFLHFVPLVQESKEAVPNWDPGEGVCKAIQFTSVVPFDPVPYSKTQTVNLLFVMSSSQIAAPWRGTELFTEWPTEARTWTCCPLWKGDWKATFLQPKSPGEVVFTLSFPVLKLSAVKRMDSSKMITGNWHISKMHTGRKNPHISPRNLFVFVCPIINISWLKFQFYNYCPSQLRFLNKEERETKNIPWLVRATRTTIRKLRNCFSGRWCSEDILLKLSEQFACMMP